MIKQLTSIVDAGTSSGILGLECFIWGMVGMIVLDFFLKILSSKEIIIENKSMLE